MADVGIQLGRVADRMAATQALRFGAERLERILDSCVEAFVTMDEGGMITGWNAAAEKVFGLSKEEALGRRLADTIVPPRFREAHHLGVGRFLTTGEKHVLDNRFEIVALGTQRRPVPDRAGRLGGAGRDAGLDLQRVVHDITDRKRTEDALRAAYEHEREAVSRLRELDVAKSDFVATVSHEFRTPLTNVIGHLEVLTSGDAGELNPAQTRMLQVIGRNSDRLRALIEDLLTISKVEAGVFDLDLAETDLTEVLIAATPPSSRGPSAATTASNSTSHRTSAASRPTPSSSSAPWSTCWSTGSTSPRTAGSSRWSRSTTATTW